MAKSLHFDLATIEQYLAFKDVAPEKQELFWGRICAMDGRWAQQVCLPGTVAHLLSVRVDLSLDELYENALFYDGGESPSGAS